MRPGREIDVAISTKVLGYEVKVKQKELWEITPLGERPLRKYSREIGYAWEVVEKLKITMLPIEGGGWFALVGKPQGWSSPVEFFEYLQKANFVNGGAAVGDQPALVICTAALKTVENKESRAANPPTTEASQPEHSKTEPPALH